ncbi:MAG: ZIP family metal transporter [Bacilli bacterium]
MLVSFLLTFLAGFSTLMGTTLLFLKGKTDKILICSLSLAIGVMLTVSIIFLIPEAFFLLNSIFNKAPTFIICWLFLVVGIILAYIIDYNTNHVNNKLYSVGMATLIAIVLHNIFEGMATFMTTNNDVFLGINLAVAIGLHNIPEGICIAMPIYYATGYRLKAFIYTFIAALAEPLGAIFAFLFLAPFGGDIMMGIIYLIIAGIMFYIAIYELLPLAISYKKYNYIIIFIIFGSLLMIISHLL